ncbi:tetratricopeptide repeat protein [Glaesserella parasuis]|uniref:tetratricopeptide repeat protein n=1 Tax=Glaesserella parasuis TaxID=738 RepID=UPI002436921E|nr:tetratricopeptide repeat protein [Glaesserella parasuis]MDG6473693.1 tetratricopeptide repeat protein [Glaesserella parasuis]MDO9800218.1 tetratricopeptide repeat protein [Glaesserella parasuis]MDO9851012.1 tetratricopeptide repeat protein [Glaesserella parasuis]MDO9864747.1 tetratricopeptide repeat protein [Glaesserella parasuis]MDO9882225.1 tetratricopeptide repeat protein [Glaesserella parasuis]
MKTIIKSLLATALLSSSLSTLAETIEDRLLREAQQGDANAQERMGRKACDNGDYYAALDWYEKAAKQAYGKDDQEWQWYRLASMYEDGQCIGAKTEQGSPNYPKALEWYTRVAFNPNPKDLSHHYDAKFEVADIYFFEKGGIKRNGAMAKRLYTEVANISDNVIQQDKNGFVIEETRSNARYRLAQMHYYGEFATQNYQLAFQWAGKAALDNNPYAAPLLAVLLYNGLGVKQDKAKGLELVEFACDKFAIEEACKLHKQMKANLPVKY